MSLAIEISSLVKDYRALRPLRIRELSVSEGEIVALSGLDQHAAEVLTNLVTGAVVPDEGVVRVFGQDTSSITDGDEWLKSLDRFAIVSDRVALLDTFTIRQNIAIPLTLELDPLPEEFARRAQELAVETGLDPQKLDSVAANVSGSDGFRVRLARALATSPSVVLVEHPTASLPDADVHTVAEDFKRLMHSRNVAALVVTMDRIFARSADRALTLDPPTGSLSKTKFGWWS